MRKAASVGKPAWLLRQPSILPGRTRKIRRTNAYTLCQGFPHKLCLSSPIDNSIAWQFNLIFDQKKFAVANPADAHEMRCVIRSNGFVTSNVSKENKHVHVRPSR